MGHESSVKNRAGQFYSLKDRDHCVIVGEAKIDAFLGLGGSQTGQSTHKVWVRKLDRKGCCPVRRKS